MGADAYLVALTRISGIVGGVFVMLLLSVIIFPKSASHQVRQTQARPRRSPPQKAVLNHPWPPPASVGSLNRRRHLPLQATNICLAPLSQQLTTL